MKFVSSDSEWQNTVVNSNYGACLLCNSFWGVSGHHIILRNSQKVRLCVENGIPLCVRCHSRIHTVDKEKRRKIIVLSVGEQRVSLLEDLSGVKL